MSSDDSERHTFFSRVFGHGVEWLKDGTSTVESGENTLDGTDGSDQIFGYRGDDTINGFDGDDYLVGNKGRDIINGGSGDDYIADGWGTGTMDGGDGIDTVDVSHTKTGAVIDQVAGTIDWNGSSPTEIAINFENAVGSKGNDTIIGTDGANSLDGRAGSDILIGGTADDTLYGGRGNDTYVYNLGDGSDVIFEGTRVGISPLDRDNFDGKDNSSSSTKGDMDDTQAPVSVERDVNWAGNQHDYLGSSRSGGHDKILFGEGIEQNDLIIALSGEDLIISLPDGETITIQNFQNHPVETLEFADGSTQDISEYIGEHWTGRRDTWFSNGQDVHTGGEGHDYLNGRSGDDYLNGAGGNDTLLGGRGEDILYGGEGNDTITGGYDVDYMDGGEGNDTVDYSYSVEDVDIDLELGQSVFGSGSVETTVNFENAVGSQGDNVITGTTGENVLDGGEGNDTLNGGAGNDLLIGGSGADIIELDFGSGIDTVSDFEDGLDIIDLTAMGIGFASLEITDSAEGVHIIYETDAGGDAIGEIILTGMLAENISEEDFHFSW